MKTNDKIENLYDYILAIRNNEGSYELFKAHEAEIQSLQTMDLFVLFDRLLKTDQPKVILPYLDKLVHIFSQGLNQKKRDLPKGILSFLHEENEAMKLKLNAIQALMHTSLKDIEPSILLPYFKELQSFSVHYQKIQNVLFPHLERADDRLRGLTILWSLQDQTKQDLKKILVNLPNSNTLTTELIVLIGNYFFEAFGLIQKEEMILFQVTLDLLSLEELKIVEAQMSDFDACFIPAQTKIKVDSKTSSDFFFNTETGHLTHQQLILVLNALPLDITLINHEDKVVYFNQSIERLFPRSAAVIGRDVRNCHPAESVHVVNEILSAFKDKTRHEAKFHIHMKNKFILIRYVPLWGSDESYQGCLEITQEISEIQAIHGDRRLLDWD